MNSNKLADKIQDEKTSEACVSASEEMTQRGECHQMKILCSFKKMIKINGVLNPLWAEA